mmetsp:Transcript_17770/g.50857  ORF Transcript_17770/g.50857 Transcript_17770/m.50857 type:complete len:251 (+) Transcript_17770:300-1052(+)|eukprot:CAMPEP_0181040862 /NCGR_PEP_ID=MMETSP1070-20121207/11283_1 /TAXON_ID=265543 /ORGANISM="Minutocellus polymorphus, Strain NH13" /LENGTH=250 /DNA_ID=CAMNT_0023118917 /DNA_START=202 /DNA_END=954 /DNA_ORIENTATION=-
MAFGLTSAAVAEFAARPFIRSAIANPCSQLSVRAFYLGIDCSSPDAPALLRNGTSFEEEMSNFWYAGHPEYDDLCRNFRDTIRKAGRNELVGEEWKTADGRIARIILCDQLSRNSFRGTEEAFLYDGVALNLAKEMAKEALADDYYSPSGDNEIYGTYVSILTLPLMHSEDTDAHHLCLELINDSGKKQSPEMPWEQKRGFLLQHTAVLEKFGRYPHRNELKGRDTTQEEEKWLASDDAPGWAKSQLPKK